MKTILILLLTISAASLIGCYHNPHYGHDNGRHERRGDEYGHRDSDHRDGGHQRNRDHQEH